MSRAAVNCNLLAVDMSLIIIISLRVRDRVTETQTVSESYHTMSQLTTSHNCLIVKKKDKFVTIITYYAGIMLKCSEGPIVLKAMPT